MLIRAPYRSLQTLALIVSLFVLPKAHADATLLLEEPYGHFGAFTATGHAAVYLDRVCAETPVRLRRCLPGETGVVISRYNKIAGYDWIAIPLIPYLYAVNQPEDVPLFVNPKVVAFLRNQYRKAYLEDIAPDEPNGEPPNGNWTQLIGSSYDRTIYGYQIETSAQQDDEFIRVYNSGTNQSHFNLLAHNCADFARGAINFYYPRTLHRNPIADMGITTPKQIAKLLVKFSAKHPELQSSSFVIPQVPGSVPRSTTVHGVVESLLKSKKYIVPVAAFEPIAAGAMAVAYLGEGRFDPKKNALVMAPGQSPERPLATAERRSYQHELNAVLAQSTPDLKARRNEKIWAHLENSSEPQLDEAGRVTLLMQMDEQWVAVGIARENVLNDGTPPDLAKELLAARLQEELRPSDSPRASQTEVMNDWKLLRQVLPPGTN
ncbi:MAG TPA: hypothetical protein VKR57_05540 [Terriglobales bacterium]|nr:hypothetical protein [Terriglobales bacterium]